MGSGVVSFGPDLVLDDFWGVEPYEICGDELDEVTGGSQCAKWALEYGDVRLPDIPILLDLEGRSKFKELRVLWLEHRLSNDARKLMERRQQAVEQPRPPDPNLEKLLEVHRKGALIDEIESVITEIRAYQESREPT